MNKNFLYDADEMIIGCNTMTEQPIFEDAP